MTKIQAGQFQIEIFNDESFSENVIENKKKYDHFYFKEEGYRPNSTHVIKVFAENNLYKSAAIAATGGGTGIHETSFILEKEKLVICCSDSIFCLSIPDLNLLWQTQADDATCFEIFKYQEDFIIHGELSISRLDKNGKILWQQWGEDIFTTEEGKEDFAITENYIFAMDWNHKKYKFNFEGEII
jgi:hypothetical protein